MKVGDVTTLLDPQNRSPQAIKLAKKCLREIRRTEDLARILVYRIKLKKMVRQVSYQLTSPQGARITVIIPTLPIRWSSDPEDPINIIRAIRDAVLKDSSRLTLTIKRTEKTEHGYIEGRGI